MRKLAAVFALTALLALPGTGQAQASFGGVAAFHEDFDFGVGPYVGFPVDALHENMRAQANFLYFFPGDFEDFSYLELNGNLIYDLALEDSSVTPFLLGGLNIARFSLDDDEMLEALGIDTSATEAGLNLGGGITFDSDNVRPALGAKIELEGGEGLVLFGSLGVGL